VLAAAALARWPVPRGASALALFGVGFIVMAHQGHEIWYDYGQPLGFALIAAASLAYSSTRWRLAPALAAGVLVGVMAVRITPALAPLLPTRAMLGRNFVAPDQIARVRRFIATLPPGTRVNFGWSGMEPFFLADLARAGARWTMVGHSVTSFFPPRAYDWRVRCDSVELPPGLLHFDIDYPRHGRDTGCDMFKPPVPAAPAPPR
jgi:hypothetical protein